MSVIDLVPSYWRDYTRMLARLEPEARAALLKNRLRLILSASEPLLSDLPREWALRLGHGARLIHMFGQTETTGIATVHPIMVQDGDGATVVPIGCPIVNPRVYLLDSSGQPVPPGVPGKLYIGGPGVGRGYLNQPGLTTDRFVPDPFRASPARPGSGPGRLYRTGDMARRLSHGTIEFLGRADHQIKIRGFRIEPGEIQAVLRQHPGVRECVVVTLEAPAAPHDPGQGDPGCRQGSGGPRLVAYVAPQRTGGLLRRSRTQRLQLRCPYLRMPTVPRCLFPVCRST